MVQAMDLTTGSIGRHIRAIAIPTSVGLMFKTFYNVVDTYFAGYISTDALAAMSLSFTVFFVILAAHIGLSQGVTALIGQALGSGDEDKAFCVWVQTVAFAVFNAILLGTLGLVASRYAFAAMGASGDYLQLCLTYMDILCYGAIGFMLQASLNGALLAMGNSRANRNVLIGGFVANCILDPIFLLVFDWGIAGIALATVLIEALGAVYLFICLKRSRLWRTPQWHWFLPRAGMFRDIAKQSAPASMNMLTIAFGFFVINFFLKRFGTEAVAAYGVAIRIEQIALLPTLGLNSAVLSITSQNAGAKQFGRVVETLKTGLTYGALMSAVGMALIWIFGADLMGLFTQDPDVIELGADYLVIAALVYAGYVIMGNINSMLQGLKRPMFPLYMGIARQIIIRPIVFWGLLDIVGLGPEGIWWGLFGSVWFVSAITAVYGFMAMRHVRDAPISPTS